MCPDKPLSVQDATKCGESFRPFFWQGAYPGAMLGMYWFLHKIVGLNEKGLDWAFYLAFCGSLPLIYFWASRRIARNVALWSSATVCFGSLLWIGLHGFFRQGNGLSVAGGLGLGALCGWDAIRLRYGARRALRLTGICAFAGFVLLHIAGKLAWWTDVSNLCKHNHLLIPVLMAAMCLFWQSMSDARKDTIGNPHTSVLYSFVVILIFLESYRSFGLFEVDTDCMHHWTCYVGPVELIRQGGQLLWNVPSQYGFLSILTAAVLPVSSAWESVYILAGTCQLVVGWALFHHFSGTRTWREVASAGILVVAGVFVIPGWMLTGSMIFPSVSALRFIWVLLMFVTLFKLGANPESGGRRQWHVLHGLWLAGVLWSFESAFYCSVTLGSYLTAEYASRVYATGRKLSELKIFRESLLLLIASIAIIGLFYRLRFGHGPDWRSFFEHALAFQGGFGALPMVLTGGLLYVLAVVGVLLGACRTNAGTPAARAIFGMVCGTLAVFSYFAGRSHENNLLNMFPIPLAALVLGCRVVQVRDPGFVRVIAVALMSPVVILGIGNRDFFLHLQNTWTHQEHNADVLVPALPPKLAQFLGEIPLKQNSSVTLADIQGFTCKPGSLPQGIADLISPEIWLPIRPLAVLVPLSSERISIYFERWHRDHPRPGWVVYGASEKPYIAPILSALERCCKLEQQIELGDYTARFYTPAEKVR